MTHRPNIWSGPWQVCFIFLFSDWPRDRLPRGIPLIQILFAITLDFLQIYKSEKLKVHFQHPRRWLLRINHLFWLHFNGIMTGLSLNIMDNMTVILSPLLIIKSQILQMFRMKLQSLLLVPYLLVFLDYLQVTAEKVDL